MANVNFHLRDYGSVEDDNTAQFVRVVSQDVFLDMYDNMSEVFCLVTDMQLDAGPSKSYTPTTTDENLYDFRVAGGTFSTSYPYDYNFGDIDVTDADSVYLNLTDVPTATVSRAVINDASWLTNSWTLGTYATFKNEVTGFLAACISNSRALTGSNVQPMSQSADWAVQFYRNQLYTTGPNTYATLVVFYPGNDPQADETIVEAI